MRAPLALSLALLALVAARVDAASSDRAAPTALPTATLDDLLRARADDVVRSAFIGANAPGAMVVREIGATYAAARRRGLDAFAACARRSGGRGKTLGRSEGWEKAHDGAVRTTIASLAKERLKMDVDDDCGGSAVMRGDLEIVRDGADAAARAALGRLDAAFHNATRGFFERSARSDMSLDNFHAYGAPNVGRAEGEIEEELDVEGKHAHTDVGVAIVMTPALLRGEKPGTGGSRGLFIGDIEPDVPDDGMIVMLGEAARAWVPGLSAELRSLIKVPTHTMRLTGERAWFGRMVLPESSLAHPEGEMTFGAWHAGAIEAAMESNDRAENERWAAVACPSPAVDESGLATSRRRILSDDNTCPAGKIYCWLTCVDAPAACADTSSASHAVCIDTATGNPWVNAAGNHCGTCAAQCPGSNITAPTGMCNTRIAPTTMYMDGFKLNGGGASQPCVALLFKSWSLHTPALLALGFFATVAMGMSIEALASLRRNLQNPGFCNCHNIPTSKSRAYAVALYAVQITLGYLLMLVSMTYHFVLFSAVIVGLLIGHIVFGAKAPVAANTTACCSFASPSDKQDCPGCAPTPDVDADPLPSCCAARAAESRGSPASSDSGDALRAPLTRLRRVLTGVASNV